MKKTHQKFELLKKIDSPKDLRHLSEEALVQLANELREFLIESLDRCGGHFGANLGAVELTIALHYVFNTPYDRLIWDVGHQAYPHKILTTRRDRIHTIKQPEGLAPFPNRNESEYDAFGTGHSSTSISAALGMLLAQDEQHRDRRAIAVIGDGGLTGGMAFEALNHAGSLDKNLIVVLNDNDMSISKNVGALTHYFARILSSKTYSSLRAHGRRALGNLPKLTKLVERTKMHVKGMVLPGTLFEELGFHYSGPIDGHNLHKLITTLKEIKKREGPQLIHVITHKGKGYKPAEENPTQYHAVQAGFYSNGQTNGKSDVLTYSNVFGKWLCDIAKKDDRLVGITPAMCEGSGMQEFAAKYPESFYDVGIAEQHALTFAAGLACENKKPVVGIYSSFLQRAYDQLIHDIALQNLDVTFAVDRAGLVGSDGSTHAGSFDLSFLRCIPNLMIMAPSDENECYRMLTTAYEYKGPAAVRYPRGVGIGAILKKNEEPLTIGKAEIRRKGEKVALLAFGSLLQPSLKAGDKLNATVCNMCFIKPLDEKLIVELANAHQLLVTIEENAVQGGAGSAVNECLAKHHLQTKILNLGLPDTFLEHGKVESMLTACGLDANGIIQSIQNIL